MHRLIKANPCLQGRAAKHWQTQISMRLSRRRDRGVWAGPKWSMLTADLTEHKVSSPLPKQPQLGANLGTHIPDALKQLEVQKAFFRPT